MKLNCVLLLLLSALPVFSANSQLIPVFQDNAHQFTGVAVSTNSGRIFVTFPRWEDPHQYDLAEVFSNNTVLPYPSQDWNSWKKGQDASQKWVCVQSAWVDDQENLWVVDAAAPQMEKVYRDSHKLVRIDLRNNRVSRIYTFKGVIGSDSYLNDVRVDNAAHTAYLTDSKGGGLVVLDTDSGKARFLLHDHPSVKAEPDTHLAFNGQELKRKGKPMQVQSDSIALSPDKKWLYYKALSGRKLYRLPADALRDPQLSSQDLASKVQTVATVVPTDGIIFDPAGNLYLTDIQNNAILRLSQDQQVQPVAKDPQLVWPDTFAWDKDGWLYVTCSQIQNMAWFHNNQTTRSLPYTLFKLKPGVTGSLTPTGR